MTLLHSKDLVNWEICSNIIDDLTQISESLNWTRMDRYGRGVWAGTLRHHNGRFSIFFGTPDRRVLHDLCRSPRRSVGTTDTTSCRSRTGTIVLQCGMTTEKPTLLAPILPTDIRPISFKECSRFEEMGKVADRKSAVLINSGSGREASKLIKVNGWCYPICSEHKPAVGRYVMAKRSRKLTEDPIKKKNSWHYPVVKLWNRIKEVLSWERTITGIFLPMHGTGDWSGRTVSAATRYVGRWLAHTG